MHSRLLIEVVQFDLNGVSVLGVGVYIRDDRLLTSEVVVVFVVDSEPFGELFSLHDRDSVLVAYLEVAEEVLAWSQTLDFDCIAVFGDDH